MIEKILAEKISEEMIQEVVGKILVEKKIQKVKKQERMMMFGYYFYLVLNIYDT